MDGRPVWKKVIGKPYSRYKITGSGQFTRRRELDGISQLPLSQASSSTPTNSQEIHLLITTDGNFLDFYQIWSSANCVCETISFCADEMQLQFNIQLKSNFQEELEQNNALLVIFKSHLWVFPWFGGWIEQKVSGTILYAHWHDYSIA